MKQHLMNFLTETKRRYKSIFEHRKIEEIIDDINNNKWVSREEERRAFDYAYHALLDAYNRQKQDYGLLLQGTLTSKIQNYDLLKHKILQGKSKI